MALSKGSDTRAWGSCGSSRRHCAAGNCVGRTHALALLARRLLRGVAGAAHGALQRVGCTPRAPGSPPLRRCDLRLQHLALSKGSDARPGAPAGSPPLCRCERLQRARLSAHHFSTLSLRLSCLGNWSRLKCFVFRFCLIFAQKRCHCTFCASCFCGLGLSDLSTYPR